MIEAEAMDDGGDGPREGEDDRKNPFLQAPVLDVFFELLSLEDLAKCRLMSKLWYDKSLSIWRSKATPKFEDGGSVFTRDDGSRRTPLWDFLDLWEANNWGSCPFKTFNLCWYIETRTAEQQRFLELVGGHITSLTLQGCSFVGRETFRRFIYQSFPTLQFLKMHDCHFYNAGDPDPTEEILAYKEPTFGVHELKSLSISNSFGLFIPDLMMDMLSHFHKVTSLHLESKVGEGDEGDYRDLMEIIRLIREQDQTKLPLENFDVKFCFELGQNTSSCIELLKHHEKLNLPLQCLEIYFDPEEDENMDWNFNDVIRDILQNHSSTLKDLVFTGEVEEGDEGEEEDQPKLCESFPYGFWLEELEELSIFCSFFDNFNFLMYTTNLRVLIIEDVGNLTLSDSDNLFSSSSQLEVGDWTLAALTDLSLDLPLSPENLQKLMKRMPNVEHFEGELDDVKFAMICKNWKNLKKLEDRGEELTDEGVIGKENVVPGAGDDGGTQGVPNISQLENLTSFTTHSSKLTSACVHNGFLKLANLNRLSLGQSTELEDEARAALERRRIGLHI